MSLSLPTSVPTGPVAWSPPTPAGDVLLEGLHAAQHEAVTHTGGPLLIIAGAGTGKTTVITRRIAYLIATKQARPNEILALTFTEKAAREMETRVDQLVPYGYVDTWISTFHAFGDRVLREQAILLGLSPTFQVLTKPQAIVFLQEHLFALPFELLRPLGQPARYLDALVTLFARAKDEDVTPQEYLAYAQQLQAEAAQQPADAACNEQAQRQRELARLYGAIQAVLRQNDRVDFGDHITLTLELFRHHPSILEQYRRQFKYVLVDEFQDTNFAQFELLKLLAPGQSELTIVADDDQSIYKFRGAAFSNILNFLASYPQARQVVLVQNYRATQPLLDAAYRLIRFNDPERLEVKQGIDKRLQAVREAPAASAPQWRWFDTVEREASWVAETMQTLVTQGEVRWRDCAILVRSNKEAEPFLEALTFASIPWQCPGMAGVTLRTEIKLLLAILRMLADPQDSLSWYFVASSPLYQVPMSDLVLCNRVVRHQHRALSEVWRDPAAMGLTLSTEGAQRSQQVLRDVERFTRLSATLSPGQLLYRFLTEAGGKNYLKSLAQPEREEELQQVAAFFTQLGRLESQMAYARLPELLAHTERLKLLADDPTQSELMWDADAVQVLTVHRAKGLEFSVVFLAGLVQGRFPVPDRRDPLELPDALIKDIIPSGDVHLQEERRLCYVGMTRAKTHLYLTAAASYGGKSVRKVSQFVLEALDLPPPPAPTRTPALEVIRREGQPAAHAPVPLVTSAPEPMRLDPHGFDDYVTCPLKYKFSHVLRVPILRHHLVIYGAALHQAVEQLLRAKQQERQLTLEALWQHFAAAWQNEGFLTRQHEELRFQQGQEVLRRFWERESQSPAVPTLVEEKFKVLLEPEHLQVVGRWDRVDVQGEEATILDYKSSDVRDPAEAHRRVRESLQMAVYALAWQVLHGRPPARLQLYFLESHLTGEWQPTEQHLAATRQRLTRAADGMRAGAFEATPSPHACHWCAYQSICPQAVYERS